MTARAGIRYRLDPIQLLFESRVPSSAMDPHVPRFAPYHAALYRVVWLQVVGCMEATAPNYDSSATVNGYCEVDVSKTSAAGCTNSASLDYRLDATFDDGSCRFPKAGCRKKRAYNYDPDAETPDDSCLMPDDISDTWPWTLPQGGIRPARCYYVKCTADEIAGLADSTTSSSCKDPTIADSRDLMFLLSQSAVGAAHCSLYESAKSATPLYTSADHPTDQVKHLLSILEDYCDPKLYLNPDPKNECTMARKGCMKPGFENTDSIANVEGTCVSRHVKPRTAPHRGPHAWLFSSSQHESSLPGTAVTGARLQYAEGVPIRETSEATTMTHTTRMMEAVSLRSALAAWRPISSTTIPRPTLRRMTCVSRRNPAAWTPQLATTTR